MTPPIRVVLWTDDYLVCEGVRAVLERLDGIELASVCGDLDTLRAEIERRDPDVVLMNVDPRSGLPADGTGFGSELRATHPRTGLVVLSHDADPLSAGALFGDGSQRRAYLLKERLHDPAELDRAIREVAEGGAFVDPRILDELLSGRRRGEHSRLGSLTKRELETLGLIAQGHSNQVIASRLAITKRAVERHINSIFAKLELDESELVSRRVMAARFYLAGQGRLTDDARV